MQMVQLKDLAAELKTAYDLQAAARVKQSEVRSRIVKLLGQEEGGLFLDMLKAQAEPARLDLKLVLTSASNPLDEPTARFAVIRGKA